MRTVWKAAALSLVLASTTVAFAQRKSEAESGLVGIRLFDSGMRLLNLYGQPDDIQSINGPSVSVAGSAGAGSPFGRGGAATGGMPRGGPAGDQGGDGRPPTGASDLHDPFGFSDPIFQQRDPSNPAGLPPGVPRMGMMPGGGPPNVPGMPTGGYPGMPGGPGGSSAGFNPYAGAGGAGPTGAMPPGFGAPPGFGPSAQPGGTASSTSYVRWVYKRGGGKYGFILDKTNKIIQIEAIGMSDPRVHTRKGLSFGASFVKVIHTYGFPDSYEVAGNTITMRYLLKNKVVFRLNRLGLDKPHVVTGILVAAAKN